MNIIRTIMQRKNERFTLMEVLISCVILGLGMVGIMAFFPGAVKLGTKVKDKSMSALVAKTAMATLEYSSYSGSINSSFGGGGSTDFPAGANSEYVWRVKLTSVSTAASPVPTANVLFHALIGVYVKETSERVGLYYTYIADRD
jgi:Tfp pilus assembly protein PilV